MAVESIQNIIDQWKSENVELNDPATIEAIVELENTLGFNFPSDFKDFYLKVDGFKNWGIISNIFSIWPIERIIDEYKRDDNKNFVGFCDACMNCHQIGYFKDRFGIYKSYDEFNPIAQTFEEAIQLINNDSEIIY